MRKIHGLWFADWRDAAGRRLRKGFQTPEEAAFHTSKMRDEVRKIKEANSSRKPNRDATEASDLREKMELAIAQTERAVTLQRTRARLKMMAIATDLIPTAARRARKGRTRLLTVLADIVYVYSKSSVADE